MYYKVSGVTGRLTGASPAAYAPQVGKKIVSVMDRGFSTSDVTFMLLKGKLSGMWLRLASSLVVVKYPIVIILLV